MIRPHGTDLIMLRETFKTKEGRTELVRVPMLWKFPLCNLRPSIIDRAKGPFNGITLLTTPPVCTGTKIDYFNQSGSSKAHFLTAAITQSIRIKVRPFGSLVYH